MSEDSYLTISEPGSAQTRVLGSRFLGVALGISSETELQESLESEKRRYHDATHWCFAARTGTVPDVKERSSDAGEPKGSAGIHILHEIQKRELTNTLVIVTRYFGGTKLGTGNLGRAYGECASLALDASTTALRQLVETLQVECSYDLQSIVYHVAQRAGGQVEPVASAQNAAFTVRLPRSAVGYFRTTLDEDARGQIKIRQVKA